jgi:serine/threonine-protein kinase SRPK3
MAAKVSETPRELSWFNTLASSPEDLSSNYIVKLLDSFAIQGPNGRHRCLVFELLGPTLRTIVKEEYRDRTNIDTQAIMRMSEQLLQGVAFIHEAKFAHGGMISYQLSAHWLKAHGTF